ncbi:MFS alpha-glucoside transporter [Aspergillus sclerotioniger CBS 115572]|uniref:MFS alpha-glucoside transporter n=1 Tax=Aspergillus sclerotioniger CBS 115572 TaxID=1450535 RepID=A0A317XDQ1_9EURO|nr:MFS alpha-glucoside transporter [Aspergillus sclerotioniger CBS 115572]PWY94660.1 MFS alpha-glucoside transporter [Aspergillus sclerotioniger CBS 115572]
MSSKQKRTSVEAPDDDIVKQLGSVEVIDAERINDAEKSLAHARFEHGLGFWKACQFYRPALLWSCFVNLAVILCGFDGALIGSLVGLTPFVRTYGRLVDGQYTVAPSWLSAFNYASYIGSVPGSLIAGIAYDKVGPRITLAAASIGSIGSIFLQFFSEGPALLFVGEMLNGFITGAYPVLANAYVSEVAPVAARGVLSAVINLSFVIGQLVASGMLKGTSTMDSKWAYKIPFASQWALPVFILSFTYFCPTPPYWLCKKGRPEEARKSLQRLTTSAVDVDAHLAHIQETLRLEESSKATVSILDCFRGTNLRRTIISCQVYNIQALCGNILFINYAVYFFEIAGLNTANAFSMNVGLTCMGLVGTLASYVLISYAGRRTIYLWGCVVMAVLLFLIGILAAVPQHNTGPVWAMSALMVVCNLVYDMSVGPLCFTVMSEVSSVNLRGVTIALSNITVVIWSVIFAVAIPYALDTTGANWGGKVGFLFAGIGVLDTLWCYIFLPETKGRTFEELDWMFQEKLPTRQFSKYQFTETRVAVEA